MAEATTGDGEVEKPVSRRPKLLLIGGFLLVLLTGAAVGIVWFFDLFDAGKTREAIDDAKASEGHAAAEATQRRTDIVFVDIPDILVNLHSPGERARFLKLKVALEVVDVDEAAGVETLMPRVMDSFQTYLRALTIDEVNGVGGLHRLKEELTARVNLALEPIIVSDVLIKEMLVQ